MKRILVLLLTVVATAAVFAEDGQPNAYSQAFVLLKNKGFLDDARFAELVRLSDQMPRGDRERLYSYFELRQLWPLSPIVLSRFELFPKYEDQTPNLAMGIGGIVGVGMLAYVFSIGINHDPMVSNGILGTTGFGLVLSSELYFLLRPFLLPRAYDEDTVNSTMRVALQL